MQITVGWEPSNSMESRVFHRYEKIYRGTQENQIEGETGCGHGWSDGGMACKFMLEIPASRRVLSWQSKGKMERINIPVRARNWEQ